MIPDLTLNQSPIKAPKNENTGFKPFLSKNITPQHRAKTPQDQKTLHISKKFETRKGRIPKPQPLAMRYQRAKT